MCNFSRKQRISLQNLRKNMKFTHTFGKFTLTFSKTIKTYIFMHFNFNKKRTNIINADICAVLSLAKKVAIYASLVCKSFGPKIWSHKFVDQYQVCHGIDTVDTKYPEYGVMTLSLPRTHISYWLTDQTFAWKLRFWS